MTEPTPLPSVRVKPGTFFEINANHISTWGYKTTDPWDAILTPNYFLPLWSRFCAIPSGTKQRQWTPDTIKVSRLVQPGGVNTPHYWEIADLVISYADDKRVTVAQIGPILSIGPDGVRPVSPPDIEKPDRAAAARAALAEKRAAEKAAA